MTDPHAESRQHSLTQSPGCFPPANNSPFIHPNRREVSQTRSLFFSFMDGKLCFRVETPRCSPNLSHTSHPRSTKKSFWSFFPPFLLYLLAFVLFNWEVASVRTPAGPQTRAVPRPARWLGGLKAPDASSTSVSRSSCVPNVCWEELTQFCFGVCVYRYHAPVVAHKAA